MTNSYDGSKNNTSIDTNMQAYSQTHTCVKAIIHTDIKISNATELMILLLYDFTTGMKIQK